MQQENVAQDLVHRIPALQRLSRVHVVHALWETKHDGHRRVFLPRAAGTAWLFLCHQGGWLFHPS